MSTEQDFYFSSTRLNEVSADELASALFAAGNLAPMPMARRMFTHIMELRERREEKNETFSRLWRHNMKAGPERQPNDRVLDGRQAIEHNELVAALMHLGMDKGAALRTAYSITCRALDEREPKWKAGDIVRSGSGKILIRQGDGGWLDARDSTRYEYPVQPIVKIGVESA